MKAPLLEFGANPKEIATRMAQGIEELGQGKDSISVALSGGGSPLILYRLLASPERRERILWDRFLFFFSDERAVPPGDADSNYGQAYQALLSKTGARSFRMPAEEEDAEGYARLLQAHIPARQQGIPSFDLLLLGMGPDGHTASLFPYSPALTEQNRWVIMTDAPKKPIRRMTFTYPLINAAQRVWVLAPGASKRELAERCLRQFDQRESKELYPINGVRPATGEVRWWLSGD